MDSNITLRPTYWASVSGGKDSLYMLYYILNHLDKYPLDGVVHFELSIDYPFVKDVVNEIEAECNRIGLAFFRIRPKDDWMDLYNKWGYPARNARWCNKWKLQASSILSKMMKDQGKRVINYIGFCADETRRFRFDLDSRGEKVTQIYPLAENGIREETIWLWAREHPIYNQYYKYNKRCGCMGCPMSPARQMAYLSVFYPEEFKQICDLASATEKEKDTYVWSAIHTDTEGMKEKIKKYLPLKELPVDPFQYSIMEDLNQ